MATVNKGDVSKSMWEAVKEGQPHKGLQRRKLRLREVVDILEDRGVNPIAEICDALPDLDSQMRVKTLLSLAEFIYPKLGRTVVAGDPNAPLTINWPVKPPPIGT